VEVKRGPLSQEEKDHRAHAREASAVRRAERKAQRRAEALRTGVGNLRAADVAALLSVHATTLWRWSQKGSFPEPTHYAGGVVCWPAAKIAEWLASREGATAPR
jgi:predicted DNA-binding transcriptional regulator AlpA